MTVSWADAHRLGAVEASRLLRALDIDVQQRIPVFEIPRRIGVVLRAGPLPRLAGAYVAEPDSDPGILVNNRHPMARQRYTVAHEIGHHVLGHATSLDADTELRAVGDVPDHERMAEAFAASLLMPRRTVHALIEVLGCDVTTASGAYQLSLALGASYAATVRQLRNVRLIDQPGATRLLGVTPATIKRGAMGEPHVGVGAADVHVVDASTSTATSVGSGDLLVLRVGGFVTRVEIGGLGEHIDSIPHPDHTAVRIRVRTMEPQNPSTPPAQHRITITADGAESHIEVVVEPPRHGVPEVWF